MPLSGLTSAKVVLGGTSQHLAGRRVEEYAQLWNERLGSRTRNYVVEVWGREETVGRGRRSMYD